MAGLDTIHDRAKALIDANTNRGRRFQELFDLTGIPRESWKTYWNRGTRISGEMVEALGKVWPQYAFWLATGITDSERGHYGLPSVMHRDDRGTERASVCDS